MYTNYQYIIYNYKLFFFVYRKFVSKNQKAKTPINEVNFSNGAPENGENSKYNYLLKII